MSEQVVTITFVIAGCCSYAHNLLDTPMFAERCGLGEMTASPSLRAVLQFYKYKILDIMSMCQLWTACLLIMRANEVRGYLVLQQTAIRKC